MDRMCAHIYMYVAMETSPYKAGPLHMDHTRPNSKPSSSPNPKAPNIINLPTASNHHTLFMISNVEY